MGDRSADMYNIMIAIIVVTVLMCLGFLIFTVSNKLAHNENVIIEAEKQLESQEISEEDYLNIVASVESTPISFNQVINNIIPAFKQMYLTIIFVILGTYSLYLCHRMGIKEYKQEFVRTTTTLNAAIEYCNSKALKCPEICIGEKDKYNLYQLRASLDTNISLFQYLFKFNTLKSNITLVSVPRYKDIICKGLVKKQNGYYVVGQYYLKRGIINLNENSEVELHIFASELEMDNISPTCILVNNYQVENVIYS